MVANESCGENSLTSMDFLTVVLYFTGGLYINVNTISHTMHTALRCNGPLLYEQYALQISHNLIQKAWLPPRSCTNSRVRHEFRKTVKCPKPLSYTNISFGGFASRNHISEYNILSCFVWLCMSTDMGALCLYLLPQLIIYSNKCGTWCSLQFV